MAVRNLTVKFLEIRSGAKANRSLRSGDDDDADGELLRVSSRRIYVCIYVYLFGLLRWIKRQKREREEKREQSERQTDRAPGGHGIDGIGKIESTGR